jgi:hypothetical protein
MLAANGPAPRRAPEIASEAITGAVWDIISAYSTAERMRYLPCLADHISFVVLAPYVGPKVAIDTIEQARIGAPKRRSLAAAAQLAAPPIHRPREDSSTPDDGKDAGNVTTLASRQSAKTTAKAAKPARKTPAKRALKASAKAAKARKPPAKTAPKSAPKPAAGKTKRAGSSRSRPRPPK